MTDVASNAKQWIIPHAADKLGDMPVFVATGDLDTGCPPDQMVDPLTDKLDSLGVSVERRDYNAGHSLTAALVQLTRDLASFISKA